MTDFCRYVGTDYLPFAVRFFLARKWPASKCAVFSLARASYLTDEMHEGVAIAAIFSSLGSRLTTSSALRASLWVPTSREARIRKGL